MGSLDEGGGTMTPTLAGRWSARLKLTWSVGLLVSIPFLVFGPVPIIALAVVSAVGCLFDIAYQLMLKARWDHDWPVHLQLVAGLAEGMASFLVVSFLAIVIPPIGLVAVLVFPFHYLAVFASVFMVAQGLVRVAYPYARFKGGRLS